MIKVKYRDRLGNNLFQYCLGRIMSDMTGYMLNADSIPGFPGTYDIVAGDYIEKDPLILYQKRGGDNSIFLYDQAEKYERIVTNIWDVVDIAKNNDRGIILDGWFQNCDYFINYRDKIIKWLGITPLRNMEKQDVVVHVRLRDFDRKRNRMLVFEYYEKILDYLMDWKQCFICTDSCYDHKFLRNFSKYDPIICNSSEISSFRFIMSFDKIILSASTFGWWAAFLSEANSVFIPETTAEGFWSASKKTFLSPKLDNYTVIKNVPVIGKFR